MIASSNIQLDYESLRQKNALSVPELKPFLLDRINEIYTIMYQIDIGIAGNRDVLIHEAIAEIKPIAMGINATQLDDIIRLLEKLMREGPSHQGSLQCHGRIDHLLKSLRQATYSYQQQVERDL